MRHATGLRLRAAFGAALSAALLLSISPAAAQSNECEALARSFQTRMKSMQEVENFQKKRPTADQACSTFGRLQEQTVAAIGQVEKNGDWCHVPADVLPGLKTQQGQIAEARKNACNAAVQQRKAAEDAKKQGLLGGGDIIGGPIRLPQGAL